MESDNHKPPSSFLLTSFGGDSGACKDEVDSEEPVVIELELPSNTADIVDKLVTATYTTRLLHIT